LRVGEISEEHALEIIAAMQADGLAAATIRKALLVMGGVLGLAVRAGAIPQNPLRRLERGERPSAEQREMRILEADEIGALLDAAEPAHRPPLAAAVFTGLRLGELLGLTWADVDFPSELIHVRKQLGRDGRREKPKTPRAVREVVLMRCLPGSLASTSAPRWVLAERGPRTSSSPPRRAGQCTIATSRGAASSLPPVVRI
jgi:integrase